MSAEDDLCFATVRELAAKLKKRAVSPVALTEAYLARIERFDSKLSAFVTLTKDAALADARRAEAEIARGAYKGPLHGVPFGVKDLLDTQGVRTTWGAKPFADRVPDRDATVVRRLREAGAVLLGKLSMIELAGGLGYHWADAAINGACRTPWDTTRWAGGSSSGSGAAVAAGLVGFAIGSETWGSILCPSAFCGVTGLRPTYGVVSRHGAMALCFTMDKVGPMARSAADCALVLAAIAGRDASDPTSIEAPAGLAAAATKPNGKAAVIDAWPEKPSVDPAVRATFDQAVAVLAKAGLAVEKTKLPDLPYGEVAQLMIEAEVGAAFDQFLRKGRKKELSDRSHREEKKPKAPATAVDYVKAMRVRTMVQSAFAEMLSRYDVIVAPNFWLGAPLVDKSLDEQFPEDVPDPVGAGGNLAGLPALAIPTGFTAPGKLPLGLQIVGRPLEEARLVAIGAAYQAATDWHKQRPPL